MKLDKSLKQEILERLKPLQPEKVILFGSYAYGEPTKDSDIDLLVVTADNFISQNFEQNMEIKLKVDRCLDGLRDRFPVAVVVHTKPMHARFVALQSAFSREILQKGLALQHYSLALIRHLTGFQNLSGVLAVSTQLHSAVL